MALMALEPMLLGLTVVAARERGALSGAASGGAAGAPPPGPRMMPPWTPHRQTSRWTRTRRRRGRTTTKKTPNGLPTRSDGGQSAADVAARLPRLRRWTRLFWRTPQTRRTTSLTREATRLSHVHASRQTRPLRAGGGISRAVERTPIVNWIHSRPRLTVTVTVCSIKRMWPPPPRRLRPESDCHFDFPVAAGAKRPHQQLRGLNSRISSQRTIATRIRISISNRGPSSQATHPQQLVSSQFIPNKIYC
mmetsp:Transcript_20994/g.54663  ORF Transcript_20994/g.54663 Transcript_20994/m.54663 type:complete len:249 (+) Transcript_20994:410-1156(+)